MTKQRGRSSGAALSPLARIESPARISVVVLKRHVQYLDIARMHLRQPMPRAYLLRAMIDFMQRSEMDFTLCPSVDDLTIHLTAYFAQLRPHGGTPQRRRYTASWLVR
jgi:hypothetical protein